MDMRLAAGLIKGGCGCPCRLGRQFIYSKFLKEGSCNHMLAATPPMGWNSWNTFASDIDEALILQTADALVGRGYRAHRTQ